MRAVDVAVRAVNTTSPKESTLDGARPSGPEECGIALAESIVKFSSDLSDGNVNV